MHLNTTVEVVSGHVGNFFARLSNGKELQVGAIVIATGGQPAPTDAFGYGTEQDVITNFDLEKWFTEKKDIPGEHVTFISCVESRFDEKECSRYCCTSMIGQALRLKRMGKKVRVLYKDIRTYTRHAEELYEQAMREGVEFIRYRADVRPQDAIVKKNGHLEVEDITFQKRIDIPSDLTVLVVGLKPVEDTLAEQLKLARSSDGFYLELHPKLGPVETASQGIYLAGVAQAPKDVRESIAQATATAAKAGALLARGVIEKEPLTAEFDPEKCIACMRCVKVCPFHAIEQIGQVKTGTIQIHEIACMGCGTCAAECNFDAIDMPFFEKDQILAQIDAALAKNPEEKCIVFTCNWCSYAGADLAGIEKRQYPPSIRIIRTMCSARIEEKFVARAFEKGAGAVLITGCRLTETGSDCHYNHANRLTWQRFQFWKRKYERKGIEPERFQLRWISAAESKEFAEKMHEMHEIVMRYAQSLRKEDEKTSVAS